MFVLTKKATFTWPVKYKIPKDGGKYQTVEFMAEFKHQPQSVLDEHAERLKAGVLTDEEILNGVLLGWSGIKTEEAGEEFPYSETNKRILFDEFPGVRAAIVIAYYEAIGGVLRKN